MRGFSPRDFWEAAEVTASHHFDSFIANLWSVQSCATKESSRNILKTGIAPVKNCSRAAASIIHRIIAEYAAAS